MKNRVLTAAIIFLLHFVITTADDITDQINRRSLELYEEAVQIRRDLHQIPEPCFSEHRTSAYIRNYLLKLGLSVKSGIAGTGIRAVLTGNRPRPVVAIRCDMDALPITEKTGLPFSSRNPGFMHACGHDAHMTNGLIAAKILTGMRRQLPGTVVFVFQPCEEGTTDGTPSGAHRMLEEGILQDPPVDLMLGLHVLPGLPAGTVAYREGSLMANVAAVLLEISGKSSHGAMPHQGIDAIYASACAIQQFQSLVSRSRDPNERAVLTIGTIEGGVAYNVIAETVTMRGTVRTFSEKTEEMIEEGMRKIMDGLKRAMGISYRYRFTRSTKFVWNDPPLTRFLIPLFREMLEEDQVIEIDPLTVGEDFSVYSHAIPSFFFLLGAGEGPPLHHPRFSVDETLFRHGPRLLAAAAVRCLKAWETR